MLLFWIVFFGVIALTFYALSISGDSGAKAKIKKGQVKDSLEVKEAEIAAKQQKILELQGQINALKSELEKAGTDYNHIKDELELAKKKEADFKEELLKREQWVKTSDEALQKIKAQNSETEKKFAIKEKALEEEFAKNVELNRQVQELSDKVKLLEKENKDKSNEIEILKRRVQDRINEAQTLTKTVEEMKEEKEHSQWVPKREFNKLNEEYAALEEESEKKEQRIKVLSDEIIQLRNQLKSKEESVRRQPEQPVDKEPPIEKQKGTEQAEKEPPKEEK
jgi:chromosome segregation ATPase